jgi:hypothetical protein
MSVSIQTFSLSEADIEIGKSIGLLVTSVDNNHSHKVETLDQAGNGRTTVDNEHAHKIINWKVFKSEDHTHKLIDSNTNKELELGADGRPQVEKGNKMEALEQLRKLHTEAKKTEENDLSELAGKASQLLKGVFSALEDDDKSAALELIGTVEEVLGELKKGLGAED